MFVFHKFVFRKRPRKKCIWKRICQIHQIQWIKYKYKYKYMVWNLIKYKYKYKYAVFVFVFVFANINTYLTPALLSAHVCDTYPCTGLSTQIKLLSAPKNLCAYSRVSNNSVDTLIKTALDFPWWLAYLIPPRLSKFPNFRYFIFLPMRFCAVWHDTVRHAASSACFGESYQC